MMCTLQLSRWCRTLRQEALEMPCRKSRATWNNAGGVIKTRDFTRKSHGKTTLFLTNHSWEKRKTHIYHVFLIITVYFVRLELFTHKHIYIYYYILIYIYFFWLAKGGNMTWTYWGLELRESFKRGFQQWVPGHNPLPLQQDHHHEHQRKQKHRHKHRHKMT
jgi:hypothetical protein